MSEIYVRKVLGKLAPCNAEDLKIIQGLENDTDYKVKITRPRNVKFHRKYWKLLGLTIENLPEGHIIKINDQDFRVKNSNHLHWLIKMEMGLYSNVLTISGEVIQHVHSIAFNKMDEGEFSNFYGKAVEIILKYFLVGVSAEDLRDEIETHFV